MSPVPETAAPTEMERKLLEVFAAHRGGLDLIHAVRDLRNATTPKLSVVGCRQAFDRCVEAGWLVGQAPDETKSIRYPAYALTETGAAIVGAATPAHLVPEVTNRGFKRLPSINDAHGSNACAFESSATSAPHVWLAVTLAGGEEHVSLHLTLDQARQVADQLNWLVDHHHQNEDPS